jgi:hypothetical protein
MSDQATRLAEIRTRRDAVPDAPWTLDRFTSDRLNVIEAETGYVVANVGRDFATGAVEVGEFVANAAADLEFLLSRVDELQGQLDKTAETFAKNAAELYRLWQFAIEQQGSRWGWSEEFTAREEGKFRGAALMLQAFLVSVGKADADDDECGAAHELIREALGEGVGDGR